MYHLESLESKLDDNIAVERRFLEAPLDERGGAIDSSAHRYRDDGVSPTARFDSETEDTIEQVLPRIMISDSLSVHLSSTEEKIQHSQSVQPTPR